MEPRLMGDTCFSCKKEQGMPYLCPKCQHERRVAEEQLGKMRKAHPIDKAFDIGSELRFSIGGLKEHLSSMFILRGEELQNAIGKALDGMTSNENITKIIDETVRTEFHKQLESRVEYAVRDRVNEVVGTDEFKARVAKAVKEELAANKYGRAK